MRSIIEARRRKAALVFILAAAAYLAPAGNLFRNGDFTNDAKGWGILRTGASAAVPLGVEGRRMVCAMPPDATERNAFACQFYQEIRPEAGTSYLIRFTTESDRDTEFDLSYRTSRNIRNLGFARRVKVPAGKTSHCLEFVPGEAPGADGAVMAFQLGIARGTIAFSDLRIDPVDLSARKLLPFSPEWKVFAPAPDGPEAFRALPQNASPRTVNAPTTLDPAGSTIRLDRIAGRFGEQDAALLYNEFESEEDAVCYAGASADWFFELHLNGEPVASTWPAGNGAHTFTPGDHPFFLPVRKGRNLLAVKVRSGSQGWRFNWGTPPLPERPVRYQAGREYGAVDLSSVVVEDGSALDLSALVDAPAGKYGRVVAGSDGLLSVENAPEKTIRLLGYGWPAAQVWKDPGSDEEFRRRAVEYAAAARRQGYNFFRAHCLDEWLMTDSARALEPDRKWRDRWDFLTAELKKQGTYLQLVVFSFGLYSASGDETKRNFERRNVHKLMFYAGREWERQRFRDGAKLLLEHVNPYTGMAWKDDPAIAAIEFYNEQYSGFAMLDQIRELDPEAYRFYLTRWSGWLQKRYAGKPLSARPPELRSGFDNPPPGGSAASAGLNNDYALFRLDCIRECNEWSTQTLRDLGYRGLVTQNGNYQLYNAAAAWQSLPAVDCHSYYKHPTGWSASGSMVGQESAVAEAAGYFRALNSMRLYGRPFFVGEYNHCFWNPWQHELPLAFTAYAAFQDYSALAIWSTPVFLKIDQPILKRVNVFDVGRSAVQRAGEFLAAMLFLRRDLTPAKHYAALEIPNRYLERDDHAGNGISSEQNKLSLLLGFGLSFPGLPRPAGLPEPPKPAFPQLPAGAARIDDRDWASTLIETRDSQFKLADAVKELKQRKLLPTNNISDPERGIYQNESGEITLRANESLIKVVTPRTEAVSLPGGRGEKLGCATLASTSVAALFGVTSADGAPLSESRRLVTVYATRMVNTGMVTERSGAVLRELGEAPALMQTGRFSFTLKTRHAAQMKCWTLRLDGRRLRELPLQATAEDVTLTIDTADLPEGPTPFFELAASPQ